MSDSRNKNEKSIDSCESADFKNLVQDFESKIDKLGNIIKSCCSSEIYGNLSIEEKVKYDLFLSYSLTSLYWVYLRTQGEDPITHIKFEVDRVKKCMDKSKQIHDRKLMPRIDQEAAKRFVRSGLWDPSQQVDSGAMVGHMSRKRKHTTFEENV